MEPTYIPQVLNIGTWISPVWPEAGWPIFCGPKWIPAPAKADAKEDTRERIWKNMKLNEMGRSKLEREIPGTTWSMCGYILTYPWLGEPSAVLGSPKVGTLISASSVSHPCSDTQTELTHNIQHAKVYPEARKETDGKFPVKNFATWWIKPNCSLIQCNSSSSCMHESPEFKMLHKWDQHRLKNWNYLPHKPTCQNHGLHFLSNHYFDLAKNKHGLLNQMLLSAVDSAPHEPSPQVKHMAAVGSVTVYVVERCQWLRF